MQETRVLVETKGTTGEETISYWFELPIDVAEFEEKLGVGAESGDYHIIEKLLPYADEVHEHTSVYQLNELRFYVPPAFKRYAGRICITTYGV